MSTAVMAAETGETCPLPTSLKVSFEGVSEECEDLAADLGTQAVAYAISNVYGYTNLDAEDFEETDDAARKLWEQAGIQVLPGAYLSRAVDGNNPGRGFIRVALVADADQTETALTRLRAVLYDDMTDARG